MAKLHNLAYDYASDLEQEAVVDREIRQKKNTDTANKFFSLRFVVLCALVCGLLCVMIYGKVQISDLSNDVVTVSRNAVDSVPPTYEKIPLIAGEADEVIVLKEGEIVEDYGIGLLGAKERHAARQDTEVRLRIVRAVRIAVGSELHIPVFGKGAARFRDAVNAMNDPRAVLDALRAFAEAQDEEECPTSRAGTTGHTEEPAGATASESGR